MQRSIITGAAVGTFLAILAALFVSRDAPVDATPAASHLSTPGGAALACLNPPAAATQVTPRVDAVATALPESLYRAIDSAAALTHARWQHWLGRDELVAAPVNLIFMGDAAAFADVYEGPEVDGWTTTGFYRARSHEAVILYSPPFRRDALATTLHELAHLQAAWHLGPHTPHWLDEGLAEYLEMLDVDASGRGDAVERWRFRRNDAHLKLLAAVGPVDLETLLSLSRLGFSRRDAPRRYASAWALVAFLNHSETGRAFFDELLRAAHAARCEAVPDARSALAAYPGGLTALEADWRRWLDAMVEQNPR
jgi:hypothetical protein